VYGVSPGPPGLGPGTPTAFPPGLYCCAQAGVEKARAAHTATPVRSRFIAVILPGLMVLTLTLSVTWPQSSSYASPPVPAAPRAGNPPAPVENGGVGAMPRGYLGSAGDCQAVEIKSVLDGSRASADVRDRRRPSPSARCSATPSVRSAGPRARTRRSASAPGPRVSARLLPSFPKPRGTAALSKMDYWTCFSDGTQRVAGVTTLSVCVPN
jgi:hypothetical protein